MFNKITLDGEVYGKLGTIKVNNREYVFTINKNNLGYLEVVTKNGETTYIKPQDDLTLAGNAGTSLTRLNERIVMNHIAAGIKEDITSGKIVNQEQLEKTISDRQEILAANAEMKKLLKGNVNDLTEEKFSKDAASMVDFLDTSVKIKNKPVDDFEIVEEGLDRTFINASMYAQLNNQQNMVPEEINAPVKEEIEEQSSNVEESVQEVNEPVQTVEPITEKVEEPNEFKINSENTTLELDADVKENTKEDIKAKAEMLLRKPDKRAAYVDTVIMCLITQLGIFGLLIFVLLLIK